MKIYLTKDQIEGIAKNALELDIVCEEPEDVKEVLKLIGTRVAEEEGHWPRNGLVHSVEPVIKEANEGFGLSITPLMAQYISRLLKDL